MSVGIDFYLWGGFTVLWFSLTAILIIGLSIAWKFRSLPTMKARQKHAQNMMMIVCYFSGVGLGLSALILIREKGVENYQRPIWLLLCITLCHYAASDFYFYRVWILYFNYKLQNEFGKVRKSSVGLNQSTILSHIRKLTSNSGTNVWSIDENKQTEEFIEWPRQHSIRTKSCFIRYRYTLGRSMMIKAFWVFFWICECAIEVWTYPDESDETKVRWTPDMFPSECFNFIGQVMCFIVLFLYPSEDIWMIKIELRLIYLIITMEIILYYTLLYCVGEIAACLSLSILEFCIMVSIAFSNYQALPFKFSSILDPICRHGSLVDDFDEKSGDILTMTNVLGSKSLFEAFEKHLKREFSLEHLNFVVAIVHYKRLCEERNHKHQDQKCTFDECQKSMEISMQPVWFTECKTSKHINVSNMSNEITQTADIVTGVVDSELCMLPKCPFKLTHQQKGRKWINELAPMLYWIESDIKVWSDMEDTAFFIFDEYCDRGSPQEINISKKERKQLIEFFSSSHIDHAELCIIFDPAFDSVMVLLENDSLRRFKRNSNFNKFVK